MTQVKRTWGWKVGTVVALLAIPAVAPMTDATHTEGFGVVPIELVFGGSLRQAETRVLLIPPLHGDLGNPVYGPSAGDYFNATLDGIHRWEAALDEFAADYPAYSYLENISVHVQIYDGVSPTTEYDVIVAYAETGGPVFRGLATNCIESMGIDPVRPRCILNSLFSNSPRAHQDVPDYPEINDLYSVTLHEFAHTFGVGHTLTRTAAEGFDLMNSPATFVYGDGSPVGDGGERTPAFCISSLDLYAMAVLYSWMPSGTWAPTAATTTTLPASVPYELYC